MTKQLKNPDKQSSLEPTDEELMRRLAEGNVAALGQVYQRFGQDVLNLLSRSQSGFSAADIEDICQDAFLHVFRTAPKYVHMGKLRAWIYKIALREAKARLRKRWLRQKLFRQFEREQRLQGTESRNGLSLYHFGDEDDTVQRQKQEIAQAIAQLPAGQREVIVLAVHEEMSGKEIAKILGLKHNAVRAKLYRARQSIAAVLRSDGASAGISVVSGASDDTGESS